jgi:hypothetical protein
MNNSLGLINDKKRMINPKTNHHQEWKKVNLKILVKIAPIITPVQLATKAHD